MRALALASWLVLALGACAVDPQEELPLPELDLDGYADVQSFVGPGCASLDCHGDPGRPLRLYALYGLRASRDLRGLPITMEELDRNLAAFSAQPPDRLLGKPLALDAGGMKHVGGDRWASPDSPEYLCMQAWLEGGSDPEACAAAAENAPY